MSSKSGSREARPVVKKTAAEARTARSTTAVRRALRGESVSHDPLLRFSRTNYLFMAGGVLLAIVGFVLLRGGDISLAPLLIAACTLSPKKIGSQAMEGR